MKTPLQIGIALTVTAFLLLGCGGKASEESKNKPATKTTTEAFSLDQDPGRNINESFLTEQAAKRQELEETILAFWKNKQGNLKDIRKQVLGRKGEILANKRNINQSKLFTTAEKDSLIKPLDEESMKLSRELIAFSE